jgi:DNA-binding NtrC family response regulator
MKAPFGSLLRIANTLLLAVEDIEFHSATPRRLAASDLGTAWDATAGPVLASVWDAASRAAHADHPVLVLGESGSGKEIIARLIHRARYATKPFVALNLAAIPDSLFESELFGHERGAFTGAAKRRPGAFCEAAEGVLFLDEVGELRPELQVKLLRTLDTNRVRPLGANSDVNVNVRVVAATNRDLRQAVTRGAFREDLFYRLASIELRVPPLRERKDDVLMLATLMLRDDGLRLSTDAAEALALAHWRGNVRNLRRAVAAGAMKATHCGRTLVEASDLPDLTPVDVESPLHAAITPDILRLAVARAGGVIQRAARDLGMARSSFYSECKRLGINPNDLRRR